MNKKARALKLRGYQRTSARETGTFTTTHEVAQNHHNITIETHVVACQGCHETVFMSRSRVIETNR